LKNKGNKMKTQFEIEIGDWSGDGHGYCTSFVAYSNKSIEETREAYFAAKQKLDKNLCPENFLCEYEDSYLKPDQIKHMINAGFCFKQHDNEDFDYEDFEFSDEDMAEYVCWFINQGDPDCKASLKKSKIKIPTLSFCGFDKKKRHINFIGYGLKSYG